MNCNKYLAIAAAALLLVSCGQKKTGGLVLVEASDQPTALEFAQSLGLGWNLGSSFDAYLDNISGETLWHDQPATQATFDAVRKAGFSSVRIPVSWMNHIGPAPEYTIDEDWLKRVAEVCGYAHNAELKCIINIHNDGYGMAPDAPNRQAHWLHIEDASVNKKVNAEIEAKITAVWTNIATYFKDEGDWLIFETFNEIHDGSWGSGRNLIDGGAQYRTLNKWNQVALDAIRAAGGQNVTRFVAIPGYSASPYLTVQSLVIPKDVIPDHIMVTMHCFDPWDYAGSGSLSEWGHTAARNNGESSDEDEIHNLFRLISDTYVRKGIPVIFSEFGCVHRDNEHDEAFRKYYLNYFCKGLRQYNLNGFIWDTGFSAYGMGAFGLIDHGNGQWIDNGQEICDIIINAWHNDNPKYTLDSIYSLAPVF